MSIVNAHAELAAVGARLSAAGLSPGSTGNVSVRVGERILCTATGADLAELGNTELSEFSGAGMQVSGPPPTKEVPLHLAAYEVWPGAGAVIHLHSPHATAISCMPTVDPGDVILPYTPYLTMRVGKVGLIEYLRPGDPALGVKAKAMLVRGYRCLLLANHGSLIVAASLADAMATAFELEESARLQLLLSGRGARTIGHDERSRLFSTKS